MSAPRLPTVVRPQLTRVFGGMSAFRWNIQTPAANLGTLTGFGRTKKRPAKHEPTLSQRKWGSLTLGASEVYPEVIRSPRRTSYRPPPPTPFPVSAPRPSPDRSPPWHEHQIAQRAGEPPQHPVPRYLPRLRPPHPLALGLATDDWICRPRPYPSGCPSGTPCPRDAWRLQYAPWPKVPWRRRRSRH
jgi:hypothetical protein